MKRLLVISGCLLAVVVVALAAYQARPTSPVSLRASGPTDEGKPVKPACADLQTADESNVERDERQRQRLSEKAQGLENGTVSFAFTAPVTLDRVKSMAIEAGASVHTLTTTYFPFAEEQNFTSSIEVRDQPVDVVATQWRLRMVATLAGTTGSSKPADLVKIEAVKSRIEQGELPIAAARLSGTYRDLAQLADNDTVFSVSLDTALDARLPDDAATVRSRQLACGGEG